MFKYTKYLEKEVERLREEIKTEKAERNLEREKFNEERNSLLDRIMILAKVKPIGHEISPVKDDKTSQERQRIIGPSNARVQHYNLEEEKKVKQQPKTESFTVNMPQVPEEARIKIINGAKQIVEGKA